MSGQGDGRGTDHLLERLVFFSDAVIAIAITLLIIEVHVPHLPGHATSAEWGQALLGLFPNFLSFGISFLVIGSLWLAHHAMMGYVTHYSPRLIWPNLFLLMSIAFLPFSTALLAVQASSRVPYVFYAVSLLVAGLLKARLTRLALQPDLVGPDVDPACIALEHRRAWILPAAALVALALTLFTSFPQWSMLAMFLIPVFRRLPHFRTPATLSIPVKQVAETAQD